LGPKIRIVQHKRNLGYAFATRSAIEESAGEHIIILDGDGEYPEENILKFIAEISPNVSLMLPLRSSKYKNWKRKLASSALTIFCRLLLKYPEKDINGGAKYINSKFKKDFKIQHGLNLVNPELWTLAHRSNLLVKFVQVNRVEKPNEENSKVFKKPHKLAFVILLYIFRLKKLLSKS
jgi:glycosyltransferase involved in cell wall biosynthesis